MVASPGGADALSGMMAKAPPGESPPESATPFMQILLQSFSAAIRNTGPMVMQIPPADGVIIPVLTAEQAGEEPVIALEKEGSKPAGEEGGGTALQPLSTALLGTMAITMAKTPIPLFGSTPQPDAVTTATGGGPSPHPVSILPQQKLLTGDVVGSPPAEANGQPPPLIPVEAVETSADTLEQDAAIPAPEKREGPVTQETTKATVDHQDAMEKREHSFSRSLRDAEADRRPAKAERPENPAQSPVKAERPVVLPSDASKPTPVTQDGRDAELRMRASPLAGSAEQASGRTPVPRWDAGITVVAGQVSKAFSDLFLRPERPVKETVRPGKTDQSRTASQETGTSRPADSGRPLASAKTILMPELSAFLSTGTVYGDGDVVTTGASEPHTAQGHQPAPTVVEPGVQAPNGQQPVATGRNVSEPIVSKAGVNVTGGQPVGETGTGKEPAALASLLHVKLTEELSRSVLDQVVKHMSLQTRGEASEMRMRLDPPSLGEVRVTVRVEEGRMHAQIEVSQPSVKVVLETNMPQLRQSLSDSGIEVRRIDVCTSGSSMSRESHEGNGDRQKRRDNGRNQISVDGVEQYRAARMMGYNTMEMIM